jgi:hypothetical protein
LKPTGPLDGVSLAPILQNATAAVKEAAYRKASAP